MKTTVELPQDLLEATKRYATNHDKTFKEVLTEALEQYVGVEEDAKSNRPGWEALAGAFKGDPEIARIQQAIDEEFSVVHPGDWK